MVLLRLRTSRTSPWIWCGAALCFIFSILLIVFGIATLILFFAVRPRTPVFDISNAKLNTILFGSPVYFNGDMLLQLNFTNPNKKLNVRFENLFVELWFADTRIATQGVLPFSLRNGKTRLEPIRLISNSVFFPVNHMKALRVYSAGAFDSLLKTNPNTWSRDFFRVGSYCNDNLNNFSESFNRTIREARKKPLLELLEDIRRQCMVRNAKRAIISSRIKTKFIKRAHLEIEETKEKAKDCIRYMACGNVHEIDDHGVGYSVDMDLKTCGCMK